MQVIPVFDVNNNIQVHLYTHTHTPEIWEDIYQILTSREKSLHAFDSRPFGTSLE